MAELGDIETRLAQLEAFGETVNKQSGAQNELNVMMTNRIEVLEAELRRVKRIQNKDGRHGQH